MSKPHAEVKNGMGLHTKLCNKALHNWKRGLYGRKNAKIEYDYLYHRRWIDENRNHL